MPYGPRYGRMEEPATPEEQAAIRKRDRKLELVKTAITEQELSWVIKTRHGEDDWPCLTYDLQWREGLPGALIMVDRDTDMDVKIYPAGMWFDLSCSAVVDGEFGEFKPQDAYLRDLADRLIQEAEDGEPS